MPQVPGTVGRPRVDQAGGRNTSSRDTTTRERGGFERGDFRINNRFVPPLPDEDVCQTARQAGGDGLSPVQDAGAIARPITGSLSGSETRPAARTAVARTAVARTAVECTAVARTAVECRGGRFVASPDARHHRPVRSGATGFAAVGDTERRRLCGTLVQG
ncbi:hypothetical protein NZK35_31270 [Stieleria sp. ICT_E10.1]|uniref:hypothetical protein n=1 Tax=Stieleria sedimenti TaxID=2976331 RepID=UPI00217FF4E7|nr:hypothetical protein [Stieleria sedimenti]MCS7471161.1 hypothetical protein [Stieleria sedimenti]